MNCGLRISDCGSERSRSARRAGFSFTEVLFAVMILGIGFIMVAAIFPVAIQQAQNSTEETTAAAVGRTAATMIEQVASDSTMPATFNVVVGPDFDGLAPLFPVQPNLQDGKTLSTALRGSLVTDGNSRYAWVPFYRRAGNPRDPTTWSRVAQIFMVPVLARNESDFNRVKPQVWQRNRTNGGGIFGTALTTADFRDGQNGAPDTVLFHRDLDIPSEGAFVIVADARRRLNAGTWVAPADTWNGIAAPELQGRIYRLGNPDTAGGAGVWELMPGFDLDPVRLDLNGSRVDGAAPNRFDGKETLVPGTERFDNVSVFVVGRGPSPDGPNPNAREGVAQDVTVYTTFITIRN
jgi:type II secretory pathway pseudopilin PulG